MLQLHIIGLVANFFFKGKPKKGKNGGGGASLSRKLYFTKLQILQCHTFIHFYAICFFFLWQYYVYRLYQYFILYHCTPPPSPPLSRPGYGPVVCLLEAVKTVFNQPQRVLLTYLSPGGKCLTSGHAVVTAEAETNCYNRQR